MRMQSAGIELSAVIAAACRYFGIEEKEAARRFNIDRLSISRSTQRVSRDPELSAATKTIQREPELETKQH
jgi:predicted regulator of amino acid metabolism with ACT domain